MTCFDYWAVVPAAGVGRRMGASIPKQYLQIDAYPVIQYTIERLLSHPRIRNVAVVLACDDKWWPDVRLRSRITPLKFAGGAERCHSVLNGLHGLLRGAAATDDRVLVHDAVRPCVRADDISSLIDAVGDSVHGGVLGIPVRDTMKRTDATGRVTATVSREQLWHAQTPQLFRLGTLCDALERAIAESSVVTDEAQAVEYVGLSPLMVEGHADNIKVTRQEDLQRASAYLRQQGSQ